MNLVTLLVLIIGIVIIVLSSSAKEALNWTSECSQGGVVAVVGSSRAVPYTQMYGYRNESDFESPRLGTRAPFGGAYCDGLSAEHNSSGALAYYKRSWDELARHKPRLGLYGAHS